jgi:hypothetical protein
MIPHILGTTTAKFVAGIPAHRDAVRCGGYDVDYRARNGNIHHAFDFAGISDQLWLSALTLEIRLAKVDSYV